MMLPLLDTSVLVSQADVAYQVIDALQLAFLILLGMIAIVALLCIPFVAVVELLRLMRQRLPFFGDSRR